MIIVDFSQIALASILVNPKYHYDIDNVRYIILNSIRNINSKFRNDYGEMVLAIDSGNSWRKEVYPYYKANRKKSREVSSLDWNAMFNILHTIREEIAENFPYKVITSPRAEADDIIATLVKTFSGDDKILIVSGDKDFQQLQKYPNVEQWDHQNKKMTKCDMPGAFLIEHIIRGDTSDGVPNILSNDDVFVVPGSRQSRMTSGKFQKFFEDAMRGKMPEDEKIRRNYIRNNMTINLDNVPEHMTDAILETFNNYVVPEKSKMLPYFIKNKLSKLMTNLNDF
jgi:hypothetical protein